MTPTTVTLTAETAGGEGKLWPVDASTFCNGLTDSTPVYLEEYVYADQTGSEMKLSLLKPSGGLFVDRKPAEAAGTDVWFINEREPETYGVLYDFTCGTEGAALSTEITDMLPLDADTYEVGHTVTAIPP